jgi:hypothetical protein
MTPTPWTVMPRFRRSQLPPSVQHSGNNPVVAQSRARGSGEWRSRPAAGLLVTVVAGLAAAMCWLIARLLFPPRFAGVASFVAAWVALYPAARLNGRAPGWSHWAGGAMVILLWLPVRTRGDYDGLCDRAAAAFGLEGGRAHIPDRGIRCHVTPARQSPLRKRCGGGCNRGDHHWASGDVARAQRSPTRILRPFIVR